MPWDRKHVKTDVGAEVDSDQDGRVIITAWASGAMSIPMTVDAAKDMIDALQYSVRQANQRRIHGDQEDK